MHGGAAKISGAAEIEEIGFAVEPESILAAKSFAGCCALE